MKSPERRLVVPARPSFTSESSLTSNCGEITEKIPGPINEHKMLRGGNGKPNHCSRKNTPTLPDDIFMTDENLLENIKVRSPFKLGQMNGPVLMSERVHMKEYTSDVGNPRKLKRGKTLSLAQNNKPKPIVTDE